MAEARDAITAAIQRVRELFPDGQGYRLEEVSDAGDVGWHVTVSFLPRGDGSGLVPPPGEMTAVGGKPWPATIIGVDGRRVYKQVEVDSEGKVKAVRMRHIVVH